MTEAWWFTKDSILGYGDGRIAKVGETHTVTGRIVPCKNGLHASILPLDALEYASGNIIWRVKLSGRVVSSSDKICATSRTYLGGGKDASHVLNKFARLCALDVIHLWEAPPDVVKFLMTGDEKFRASASASASARASTYASASARASASASASTYAHARAHARASAYASASASASASTYAHARARATKKYNKMLENMLLQFINV